PGPPARTARGGRPVAPPPTTSPPPRCPPPTPRSRRTTSRSRARRTARSAWPPHSWPQLFDQGGAGDAALDGGQALGVLPGAHVVGPHDEGVLVRLDVVVAADAGGPEAELAVHGLGRLVADPHLERQVG